MKNVEVEGIEFRLKSIRVAESKTITGSEII